MWNLEFGIWNLEFGIGIWDCGFVSNHVKLGRQDQVPAFVILNPSATLRVNSVKNLVLHS
jgi:hypothetical protein